MVRSFGCGGIYLNSARIAYHRYDEICGAFADAFEISGSVYRLDKEMVVLGVDENVGGRIESGSRALSSVPKAKEKFDQAVAGLVTRRAKPEDVVKDAWVAFEEYVKQKSGEKDFSAGVTALRAAGTLTSTQAELMKKLYGFRSETFGPTHAGAARTPTESDALWFIDTVAAQVVFLDRVTTTTSKSATIQYPLPE